MDAVVLTRMLGSKREAEARAAVARLGEHEENERAVRLLADILDGEERKIAACERRGGGGGWEWLVLLDVVGLILLAVGGVVAGTQQVRLRRLHGSRLRRNAALALAARGDRRAFGPLVELFGWSRKAADKKTFAVALERLVPRLRPGDAPRVLNARQRDAVRRIFTRRGWACEAAEADGCVALLRAVAAMHDADALPDVTSVARSRARTPNQMRVAAAAARCRDQLQRQP